MAKQSGRTLFFSAENAFPAPPARCPKTKDPPTAAVFLKKSLRVIFIVFSSFIIGPATGHEGRPVRQLPTIRINPRSRYASRPTFTAMPFFSPYTIIQKMQNPMIKAIAIRYSTPLVKPKKSSKLFTSLLPPFNQLAEVSYRMPGQQKV
jgi:hypothetical protein